MMGELVLLPQPRQVELTGGQATLPDTGLIAIEGAALLFEGQTAQAALAELAGLKWSLVAGTGYPAGGLRLVIDAGIGQAEGYRLTIDETQIMIAGADAAGLYYGVCTLRQIMQQMGRTLPTLRITDWPDYPARGVMLDVSRDRVPTMATIYGLIDKLASWKINQFQLYIEHTFAYQAHPEVWAEASPFTGQDILELDAYCKQRHIELVPNQNSLGHMERWLKFERYLPLAECPDGFIAPWSRNSVRPASTLNPLDPGSIELVKSMYDELLPHFTSLQFNVGGDEPWELGQGKSKEAVEAQGGRVYLDYVLKLHKLVTSHGRRMQFWADIIVKHPELVPELPTDVIPMLWGYEGDEAAAQEWERQCSMVAAVGLGFYVCPGTSSWNSIAGRTDNTVQNLRMSAKTGLKHGAVGYLITDWGDNGSWQPLSVSYLGFAYGAALAWQYEANEGIDLPRALDLFAFGDRAGVMGKIAYDLGNAPQLVGPRIHNANVLFYGLQESQAALEAQGRQMQANGDADMNMSAEALHTAIARIEAIIAALPEADMPESEGTFTVPEYRQAADLLRHSAERLLLVMEEPNKHPSELLADLETLVDRQREIWLARHRPGGLEDSVARFNNALNDYRSIVKAIG